MGPPRTLMAQLHRLVADLTKRKHKARRRLSQRSQSDSMAHEASSSKTCLSSSSCESTQRLATSMRLKDSCIGTWSSFVRSMTSVAMVRTLPESCQAIARHSMKLLGRVIICKELQTTREAAIKWHSTTKF